MPLMPRPSSAGSVGSWPVISSAAQTRSECGPPVAGGGDLGRVEGWVVVAEGEEKEEVVVGRLGAVGKGGVEVVASGEIALGAAGSVGCRRGVAGGWGEERTGVSDCVRIMLVEAGAAPWSGEVRVGVD